jgi:diguanylate cyclase (GGDEF)-like protein
LADLLTPLRTQGTNWLKSRLSWRIIMSVFITIILVQGIILYSTTKTYQSEQLNELQDNARITLASLVASTDGANQMDDKIIQRLLATTNIKGIAFYAPNRTIAFDVFGEPPLLTPDRDNANANNTWLSPDRVRYEAQFGPSVIRSNYVAVVRMNSENVRYKTIQYILQTAVISLLLSAFITTVLILVMGMWLLEPIMLLRNNLLQAAKDPSNAMNFLTSYGRRDELGSVISSANKLIKQNSDNLTRLSEQVQDKIYQMAFFDTLTGLSNRTHFLNKLDEMIQDDKRDPSWQLGILVIDIDNFGDVNDTLGYELGDLLLKNVAEKLKDTLHSALLIARLSEDEFAAIVPLSTRPEGSIMGITNAVFDIFMESFDIQGNELVLQATLGMAMWPNDADRAIELLKKAESALDQAKLEDKGHFRLYSPVFEQNVQARIQMVRDLRVAIEEKQFALVYQPQFDAKTRKIIGAEALIRWEKLDPDTGKKSFVRPDHFIPVAEQSGLIVPIGRWVLEEACRFAKESMDLGVPPFRMAINLSGVQFARDDIVQLTKDVLARTGLEPHYLELEVTESAVMRDINQTIALLDDLRKIGVELAIDDFGTGYSSLSYLKRFPVHRLKVDRSFVMNVNENKDDASITSTIIQLGHSIGVKVIAEGVETEDQMKFLIEHKCDEFQGYYFSKPLPPGEFRGFVKGYVMTKAQAEA